MAVTLLGRFAQVDEAYRQFFTQSRENTDAIYQMNEKALSNHDDISRIIKDLTTVSKSMTSRLDKIHELASERWEMLERENINKPTNELKGALR